MLDRQFNQEIGELSQDTEVRLDDLENCIMLAIRKKTGVRFGKLIQLYQTA